jgi:hypothetical protein
MIDLVTLFVGLLTEHQDIRFSADQAVTSVEVEIDGKHIETMNVPPWKMKCDLGPELKPHLLTAIARNENDETVGRVQHGVNITFPEQEVKGVLVPYLDESPRLFVRS